jgi:hypothetical protein
LTIALPVYRCCNQVIGDVLTIIRIKSGFVGDDLIKII